MENFILAQTQQNKEFLNQVIHINELIKQLGTKVDSIITRNKMLETQISPIAQQQAPQVLPGGQFPRQPQPNPREQANAVTIRSGTTYDEPEKPALSGSEAFKKSTVSTDKVEELEGQKDQEVKDKGEDKEKVYVPPSLYKPLIPYPQRLKQTKK